MTREEFLARCANIYDTGHAEPSLLFMMRDWLDAVMRYEAFAFGADPGKNQKADWDHFIESEQRRIEKAAEGNPRIAAGLLANDKPGYALQELAAILVHPCQICATSPRAWWTRPGFCTHGFYERAAP
jgi:hypothetical protein